MLPAEYLASGFLSRSEEVAIEKARRAKRKDDAGTNNPGRDGLRTRRRR
jgi:hypothetical protein